MDMMTALGPFICGLGWSVFWLVGGSAVVFNIVFFYYAWKHAK